MHYWKRLPDIGLITLLGIASFAVVLRVGLVPSDPSGGIAVIYAPGRVRTGLLSGRSAPGPDLYGSAVLDSSQS